MCGIGFAGAPGASLTLAPHQVLTKLRRSAGLALGLPRSRSRACTRAPRLIRLSRLRVLVFFFGHDFP